MTQGKIADSDKKLSGGVTPLPEFPGSDDRLVVDVRMSRLHYPSLTVADELGLFPLLNQSPLGVEDVADKLDLSLNGAEALLGILTSLGFLARHKGSYHLTESSRTYLLPSSPYYYGGILVGARNSEMHKMVREAIMKKGESKRLTDSWRTGDYREPPKEGTRYMHSHTFAAAMGVARRGDFREVKHLLDVGSGSGGFCIALALHYPEMKFTVLDLPGVCEVAREYIQQYGLTDQIGTFACNMFKDRWPPGHDAIFFSNVFHDWSREACLHLARRSFEVLPHGGRIYVHETLLSDTRDGPLTPISFSMHIIIATERKQFSASELEEILTEAGFQDISISRPFGYYSLINARKP